MSRPTVLWLSCVLYTEPFVKDILGGIDISVMLGSAGRTTPLPDGKALDFAVLSTTAGAKLGGREEPVNKDDFLSIPLSLILQLTPDLPKRGIGKALCQVMVLYHALGIKVLYTDDVILPYEGSGHLMDSISPLVRDLLMEFCDLDLRLLAAIAPLLLSGELPLEASQTLLILREGLVIRIQNTIGGGSQCLYAEINQKS